MDKILVACMGPLISPRTSAENKVSFKATCSWAKVTHKIICKYHTWHQLLEAIRTKFS